MATGAEELKAKLLELLKSDEEFRLAVAGLIGLGEILAELRKLREDMKKLYEKSLGHDRRFEEVTRALEALGKKMLEHDKRFEALERKMIEHDRRFEAIEKKLLEHDKRFEAIERKLMEHDKRFEAIEKKMLEHDKRFEAIEKRLEEHSKILLEHSKRIEELTRAIQALGCRWGLLAEEAFREGMRGIVEKILGAGRVERWVHRDDEGFVYGYPSVIEIDLVVRDKEHVLVEVKASIDRSDVLELKKIGELYEKVTGVKPRLVIVTPYARNRAKDLAAALGVEVYEKLS